MRPRRAHGTLMVLFAAALAAAACSRAQAVEDLPPGSDVVVKLDDGALVRGKLMSVDADAIVIEQESTGKSKSLVRDAVVEVELAETADKPSIGERMLSKEPAFDDVTIPAGTVIEAELETSLASDASRVEDLVRATRRSPVMLNSRAVLPANTQFTGTVTTAVPSGKVKGRAQLAFSFDRIVTRGATYDVATKPLTYVAEATKDEDALKIGAGAAAGAIIGGLAGGSDGAAIGAAIGGGAGTAAVLATSGDEVRLAAGRTVRVELTRPLTVRVPKSESPDE